jgi:y4mF family transcriptional regulator
MDAENTMIWRSGAQLGMAVRTARERKGLTQTQLARRAGVGMKFLYELESGKDTLRADKVLDVLDVLGLQLVVAPSGPSPRGSVARAPTPEARQPGARYRVAVSKPPQRDYIGMACTTAGISLRKALTPDELVRALLTGEPTPGKHAHFIVLLEEAPDEPRRTSGRLGETRRRREERPEDRRAGRRAPQGRRLAQSRLNIWLDRS